MGLLDLIFGGLNGWIEPSSSLDDLKKSIRKDSKEDEVLLDRSAQPLRSFDEMEATIRKEQKGNNENKDKLTGLSK